MLKHFSKNLNVLNRFKLMPHDIYNLEENGLTTVQEPPELLAAWCSRQVGQVTPAERG